MAYLDKEELPEYEPQDTLWMDKYGNFWDADQPLDDGDEWYGPDPRPLYGECGHCGGNCYTCDCADDGEDFPDEGPH